MAILMICKIPLTSLQIRHSSLLFCHLTARKYVTVTVLNVTAVVSDILCNAGQEAVHLRGLPQPDGLHAASDVPSNSCRRCGLPVNRSGTRRLRLGWLFVRVSALLKFPSNMTKW